MSVQKSNAFFRRFFLITSPRLVMSTNCLSLLSYAGTSILSSPNMGLLDKNQIKRIFLFRNLKLFEPFSHKMTQINLNQRINLPIFGEIRVQFSEVFNCIQANFRLFIVFRLKYFIVVLLENMASAWKGEKIMKSLVERHLSSVK